MSAVARCARIWSIVSLLLLCYVAQAQDRLSPTVPNGKWDVSIWAAGATGEENTNSFSEARIWTAGVYLGKVMNRELAGGWRRGSLEYGFDLIPLFVTSKNQSAHGGAFEPIILKWLSSHGIGRSVPYIELAGGAVFTTTNLPPGNTSNVNFMARGGGGIQVFTRKRQSLDIACGWMHVSNANLGVRNPEFNGIQVKLGYHWFK
jgi:hypothetical protein